MRQSPAWFPVRSLAACKIKRSTLSYTHASLRRIITHLPGHSVIPAARSVIISSVSRFKELESRLEDTERQLRLVQKISRFMAREVALASALEGVVSLVVEFMACDSCLLYLLQ